MAFIRRRLIKGRWYLYEQTSVRVGRKVKTISRYLGTVGEIMNSGTTPDYTTQADLDNQAALARASDAYRESIWRPALKPTEPTKEDAKKVKAPETRLPTANLNSVLPYSEPPPSSAEPASPMPSEAPSDPSDSPTSSPSSSSSESDSQ